MLQQPTDPGSTAAFSGVIRRCVIRMQDIKCHIFTFVFHLSNPCYICLEIILSIYVFHYCQGAPRPDIDNLLIADTN